MRKLREIRSKKNWIDNAIKNAAAKKRCFGRKSLESNNNFKNKIMGTKYQKNDKEGKNWPV